MMNDWGTLSAILIALFTFLGTCVISIRMIIGWHYKYKIKMLDAEEAKEMRGAEEIRSIIQGFKDDLKDFRDEIHELIVRHSGLETRLKILEDEKKDEAMLL